MAKKLRKVVISVTAFQSNAGSFVNESSDDLHIRKIILTIRMTATALVVGDACTISIDEVPTPQEGTDDSRSAIISTSLIVGGGTGAIAGGQTTPGVITFERNQLVLEPDEALFLNTQDFVGAPAVRMSALIYYED